MNFLLFGSEMYALEIMQPLEQEIKQQGHQVAWFFSKPVAQQYLDGKRILQTVDQVKSFNPQAVFAPGNWAPDFFPGVKVQIFHGFGIEKKGHFRIRGFFDLYCTFGELTTVPFQKLARKYGHFKVVETGWPKVDPLFHSSLPETHHTRPQILYAPTFSPSLTSAPQLLEQIKHISQSGKYDWIIKFHPKMDVQTIQQYRNIESEFLSISEAPEILPLLKSSDLMLTDTSSVVYEYMLLQKPVLTFNNKNPGGHVVDFSRPEQLESGVEQTQQNRQQVIERAKAVSDKMHPYRDGLSSKRVLQAAIDFINSDHSGLQKKPLNLLRKWRIRKAMGYYHWH
jgi:CDP-glycerol glycerophosphotransferase (TagB/SpsB family)